MSAAQPDRYPQDAFRAGGALDKAQGDQRPHLHALQEVGNAALTLMAEADADGLTDFGPPDENGVRKAGDVFWRDFIIATRAVVASLGQIAHGRASIPSDWALIAASPATGPDRAKKLCRLAMHYALRGDSNEELLIQLCAVDRATNLPPEGAHRCQSISLWAMDRRDERRGR